jgi:hypothetical protein
MDTVTLSLIDEIVTTISTLFDIQNLNNEPIKDNSYSLDDIRSTIKCVYFHPCICFNNCFDNTYSCKSIIISKTKTDKDVLVIPIRNNLTIEIYPKSTHSVQIFEAFSALFKLFPKIDIMFYRCKISNETINFVASLSSTYKNIHSLGFYQSAISEDVDFSSLQCTSIKEINMLDIITYNQVIQLLNLKSLVKLRARDCDYNGPSNCSLSKEGKIRELDISSNINLTSFHNITHLTINVSTKMSVDMCNKNIIYLELSGYFESKAISKFIKEISKNRNIYYLDLMETYEDADTLTADQYNKKISHGFRYNKSIMHLNLGDISPYQSVFGKNVIKIGEYNNLDFKWNMVPRNITLRNIVKKRIKRKFFS